MRYFLLLLPILVLVGCTSTIKLNPGCMAELNKMDKDQLSSTGQTLAPCVVEAEDYIVTLKYDAKKNIYTWSMRPKKWYESSVNSAIHGLSDLLPLVGQ